MTDLSNDLRKLDAAIAEVNRLEAVVRKGEREYWTERGFSVLPRRERLKASMAEDAKMPTPLEAWLESTAK